ncbi:hypothetical protein GDO81_018921 [Engystomops pustulosus]|uniref:Uncharacterized protein n=1 Tax=Engystomops pustulosus TaxID=76066 RepID=A0AAV6YTI0_ENGPU|nr:hypothetical protein GDO81_018921 [Engystomops pustulosus]
MYWRPQLQFITYTMKSDPHDKSCLIMNCSPVDIDMRFSHSRDTWGVHTSLPLSTCSSFPNLSPLSTACLEPQYFLLLSIFGMLSLVYLGLFP